MGRPAHLLLGAAVMLPADAGPALARQDRQPGADPADPNSADAVPAAFVPVPPPRPSRGE